MTDQRFLLTEEQVQHTRRLHRDPPIKWDGKTAWSLHDGPGGVALLESAVVDCPDCDETAMWRDGYLRCSGCGEQEIIG